MHSTRSATVVYIRRQWATQCRRRTADFDAVLFAFVRTHQQQTLVAFLTCLSWSCETVASFRLFESLHRQLDANWSFRRRLIFANSFNYSFVRINSVSEWNCGDKMPDTRDTSDLVNTTDGRDIYLGKTYVLSVWLWFFCRIGYLIINRFQLAWVIKGCFFMSELFECQHFFRPRKIVWIYTIVFILQNWQSTQSILPI